MAGPTYTVEQLEHLRKSPLVQKPDGLPSIEQWMDVPADQNNNSNNNNRRPRSGNHGDSNTGEHRSERPSLMNAGSMGHFGRRASMQPDDTVLGPPKLSFTSARRDAKTTETSEKRGIISIDGDHLGDGFPSNTRQRGDRWGRDRDGDNARDKPGFSNGRRPAREEGEGWTNVKGRKSLGQEDFDRGFGRNGDREKSHKDGEADNAEGQTRRTGTGRDNFERWGRREDTPSKENEGAKLGPTGRGGWRDRERERDRDRDRDWHRGATKAEEDPEWMDTPRLAKEKKQAHTQEEFQRWKELMKAKDAPPAEKEDTKAGTPAPEPTPASSAPSKPLATPGGTEVPVGNLFGAWGKGQLGETTAAGPESTPAKPKPPVKKSRFMTMFDKPEEPQAAAPQIQGLAASTTSPAPPFGGAEGGNADEDKQGFQRILQMLGGTNISGAPGAPPGMGLPNNGPPQGGIPLDFNQASPPEERPDSRPQRQQVHRSLEQQALLENILAPRPSGPESRPSQNRFTSMSPDNGLLERFGAPRPDSKRPGEDFPIQQPPSRNSSAQDAHLHALLNSRAREETNRDPQTKQRERDFLLTLMQQPRNTPPHMLNQGLPRPPSENQNMPYFDQGPQRPPQGQPKGRGGPPPGFMEDPRFIPDNEMARREQRLRELQQQEAMRAKDRGLNMGFNPNQDDPMLQRRNTAGEIPRQMTNMGIPSQPIPDMQFMGGRQPGMPPTPNERSNIAPPPGFGGPGGMRQPPPGLGGPGGPGGPQQMPPFSTGNTPLHPPGFGPPSAGMRGGPGPMFPGGPGPNQMPPGPPQGYFPPQGFGGPPDPRMMMGRPEFDQFGGPGPRQGGRPPNMY